MKTSILVPVYNEAATILQLIEKVEASGLADEIIVINDGSTDKTAENLSTLKGEKYKIINLSKNGGKGIALREGLKHVSNEIVIIQDADMEYDPNDYAALIEPIKSGRTAVVYGHRLGLDKVSFNGFVFGRWLLTFLTNVLYKVELLDEPCGYKVFKTDVIKKIPLICRRFEFCPEITAKVVRSGYLIHQVPINYYPRTIHEGKKIRYRDGLIAVITLFRFRFWKAG
ncbi:MAG: glycosyltransferase family 2 protein [Deltaproteobacteria bacterium]|nr:glycosyltransferase family 2 protein [Deltaproteobacteria bacterium]